MYHSTPEPHEGVSSALRYQLSSLIAGAETVSTAAALRVVPCPQHGALTLAELGPVTGRRHQLRIHCAALGCPIVGDDLHCGGLSDEENENIGGTVTGTGRGRGRARGGKGLSGQSRVGVRRGEGLFLACTGVSFEHPSRAGARVDVRIPAPAKFDRLLQRAERGANFMQQQQRQQQQQQ